LLSTIPTHEQKGDIFLQEDSKGNLIIKGLTKHTVSNEEEAFNLLFEGEANRTISEHQLNKESTRSHCLFTIYLEMKSRIESTEKVITSKLNFVDLAGSERVKKTGSTGLTLKEATYINKSLTFLEQVVVSLSDKIKKSKSRDHVPYRQSKLTHLLKDSIGGNCRTVMIATIWPEEPFINETLSTLNFAKRMMSVMNEATVNIQLDTAALLRKYQKEIKELKQELAMHNTLASRGRINYDPYTAEEQYQQQVIAKKFLLGESEDIEFESIRQAKELFYQCRFLFQKIWNTNEIGEIAIDKKNFSSQNINKNTTKQKLPSGNEDGVGVLEIKTSFSLGKASRDAKPVNKSILNFFNILVEVSNQNINVQSDNEEEKYEKQLKENDLKISQEQELNEIPEKNTAFQIYKVDSQQAREIQMGILRNTEDLKIKKTEAKEFLEKCNSLKAKIEEYKIILNEKKLNKLSLGDDMTNIIDEEEFKVIDSFKGVKESYKEHLEKFKTAKSDISLIKNNLDILKVRYVDNFEAWFFKKYGIKLEDHELRINKVK
jgi:kinesin family protein 6/9